MGHSLLRHPSRGSDLGESEIERRSRQQGGREGRCSEVKVVEGDRFEWKRRGDCLGWEMSRDVTWRWTQERFNERFDVIRR